MKFICIFAILFPLRFDCGREDGEAERLYTKRKIAGCIEFICKVAAREQLNKKRKIMSREWKKNAQCLMTLLQRNVCFCLTAKKIKARTSLALDVGLCECVLPCHEIQFHTCHSLHIFRYGELCIWWNGNAKERNKQRSFRRNMLARCAACFRYVHQSERERKPGRLKMKNEIKTRETEDEKKK